MSGDSDSGVYARLMRRLCPPKTAVLDDVVVALSELPLTRVTKRRILSGGYETHERLLLKQALSKGDHVLELGASLGIVSCLILKMIGREGRLVAVEANPQLAEPFRRQLHANGLACDLVNALCCPIWDGSVPAGVAAGSFRVSGNTLAGRAVSGESAVAGDNWRTASMICDELAFVPNVLVCDIEGGETVWLESGPTFPETIQTLIVELHPWINGPDTAGAILTAIMRAGFDVVAFSGSVFSFRRARASNE
jgi:FkbM family methyltransferase